MSEPAAATVPHASAEPGILADLLDLTKARLNLLVLITTFVGYWMGAPGEIKLLRLVQAMLGTALFATAAIAQIRRPETAPPAHVLGVPAWQLATAGFISTLAGGLWLRRLV